MIRALAVSVALAFSVSSCGSSGGGDGIDTVPDTLRDVDEPTSDADALGVSALELALEQSESASNYRVSVAQAQTIRLPGVGLDQSGELDRSAPASVVEVDGSGRSMASVDIGALYGAGADLDVDLVIWQDDQRVLLDLTSYEQLVAFDPTLADSPFRPGLAQVDLERAAASGVEDIVELLAGQPLADPATLALELGANLDGAAPIEGKPDSFSITTTYANFVEATGQDLEVLAQGIATGVAAPLGLAADELTDLYISVYRNAPAQIEVTIDSSGVDVIELNADLSAIWGEIGQITDVADADFEGGVLTVEAFYDFDLDDSIVIEFPDGDFEDRTDELVELFTAEG